MGHLPPSRHRRRLGERDGGQCPHSGKAAGANAPAGVSRQKCGKQLETSTSINPGISKIRVLPSGTSLQTLDAMT